MKKFALAGLIALSLIATPADARRHKGPTDAHTVVYTMQPSTSAQFTVEHHLGYIPQVQIVSGDSRVMSNIFYLDEQEVTFTLDNLYLAPSAPVRSEATVYVW